MKLEIRRGEAGWNVITDEMVTFVAYDDPLRLVQVVAAWARANGGER